MRIAFLLGKSMIFPFLVVAGILSGCKHEEKPYLSNLQATAGSPLYTTYAAAMERSEYTLDEGYEFLFYKPERGLEFITDTGGDIAVGFKTGDKWIYKLADMFKAPVITTSYPDLVIYHYYPVENLRVDVTFLVQSSYTALVDIQLKNEGSATMDIEVVPFIKNRNSTFEQVAFDSKSNAFSFTHNEFPDSWTIEQKLPYVDKIQDILLFSEKSDTQGVFTALGNENPIPSFANMQMTADEQNKLSMHSNEVSTLPDLSFEESMLQHQPLQIHAENYAKVICFNKRVTLKSKESRELRMVRSVNRMEKGIPETIQMAQKVINDTLSNYITANEKLFSKAIRPQFKNPEKEMLYWSSFNMMRQVFLPPEGKSSYNYYVFSREPTWGWGHGGQVFHESIAMLSYALLDPESAMNSQRVYAERQYPNGYINYRTGSYLDEIIEHDSMLTSSAPWYAWQNWEVYNITHDRTFLKEMYESSKKFYDFYVKNRDKDGDGLCEWNGHAILESVRDALVAVWDEVGWPSNFEGIDVNSMLVMEAKSLEKMALELGLDDEAILWKKDWADRADLINKTFWDEETGFYYNADLVNNSFTFKNPNDLKRKEIIGFLPMWAGIVPQDRIEKLTAHLFNPDEFWRKYGVPTLSADDSYYNAKGYWNGPVWVEWDLFIMQGLLNYGYNKEAKELVDRVSENMILQLKKDHNLWEFYSPDEQWAGYHKTYIWAGIINRMMRDTEGLDIKN